MKHISWGKRVQTRQRDFTEQIAFDFNSYQERQHFTFTVSSLSVVHLLCTVWLLVRKYTGRKCSWTNQFAGREVREPGNRINSFFITTDYCDYVLNANHSGKSYRPNFYTLKCVSTSHCCDYSGLACVIIFPLYSLRLWVWHCLSLLPLFSVNPY